MPEPGDDIIEKWQMLSTKKLDGGKMVVITIELTAEWKLTVSSATNQ